MQAMQRQEESMKTEAEGAEVQWGKVRSLLSGLLVSFVLSTSGWGKKEWKREATGHFSGSKSFKLLSEIHLSFIFLQWFVRVLVLCCWCWWWLAVHKIMRNYITNICLKYLKPIRAWICKRIRGWVSEWELTWVLQDNRIRFTSLLSKTI